MRHADESHLGCIPRVQVFSSYALDLDTSRSCFKCALDEWRKSARDRIFERPDLIKRRKRNPLRQLVHVNIPEKVPESATRLVIVNLAGTGTGYLGTLPVWFGLDERLWNPVIYFNSNSIRRVVKSRSAQSCEFDTSFVEHAVLWRVRMKGLCDCFTRPHR